jgi:hypothetical protein
MMVEPRRRGHMATVTPRAVGSLSFSGWQEHLRPLLTRDPCSLRYKTKTDSVSDGSAPNLAPLRRRLHDLLLRPDVYHFAPARICVLVHPLWLCM